MLGLRTSRIRVELNGEGIRELLRSEEVASDLKRRAEHVAEAARGRYAELPVGSRDRVSSPGAAAGAPAIIPVTVQGGEHATRAYVRVAGDHPAALAVEAAHRVLGQSVDAAGD
jgi:hypothetical protein